ncbi:unnamed protein product [Linum tenue]|uniref:CCHC-type domain-containing protein n=1 Tax=Linum tenue TaxID=586396 RepID=A0AAV0RAX6_9ROSI|nr:unnamed protein product [Linum tenue]
MSLGNLIGRTIKLDYHTLNGQRRKFARLAVEVDMSKPLVPRIWLDGAWQKVEYENLPAVCFECGKIGHNSSDCPALRMEGELKQLAIVGVDSQAPAPATTVTDDSNPGFGPWMLVTKKSRRNSRDLHKKGKLEGESGQSSPKQLPMNGKNGIRIKESGDPPSNTAAPKALGSQRASSNEKKGNSSQKEGTNGSPEMKEKGKGKAIAREDNGSNKGILGSGPSQNGTKMSGPRPASEYNKASTSASSPEKRSSIASRMDLDLRPAELKNPTSPFKLQTSPPPIHTVLSDKGTNIQIISIQGSPKHSQHSDVRKPTAGKRTNNKGNSDRKVKKGTPVKQQAMKALQVWSPIKDRKSRSKNRLAALTLQEINAWTSAAQKTNVETNSGVGEVAAGDLQTHDLEETVASPPSL